MLRQLCTAVAAPLQHQWCHHHGWLRKPCLIRCLAAPSACAACRYWLGSDTYKATARTSGFKAAKSTLQFDSCGQLAACKILAFKLERGVQPFEYRSVRYWSKEINGTRTRGRKRKFFNSRRRGGRGHRAAAPVESCQSLPQRSPWGRLGSVLYTRKRLHRRRRRFKHFWSISLSRPRHFSSNRPRFASRAL